MTQNHMDKKDFTHVDKTKHECKRSMFMNVGTDVGDQVETVK